MKGYSGNLCDLDPEVNVEGKKAGIWDGVPSTGVLFKFKKGLALWITCFVITLCFIRPRSLDNLVHM